MTSTHNPLENLILTPHQQQLLFAALNSNRPTSRPNSAMFQTPLNSMSMPGVDGLGTFQTTPGFGFDYDFSAHDTSFDFSFDDGTQHTAPTTAPAPPANKAPSKPESTENDSPEKRSRPDDGEGDNAAKRRESQEKVHKKPGRKPLTDEPSSKRKAQNRAAQRAFRERKERHLRELENKVQELTKLSEAANNENQALRAQVERLTVELNEYKKRLSLLSSGRPAHQGPATPFGHMFVNNLNDINFQFEFPKFGSLPGPPVINTTKKPTPVTTQDANGYQADKAQDGISPTTQSSSGQIRQDPQLSGQLTSLNTQHGQQLSNGNAARGSVNSLDSPSNQNGTSTSSPSASSSSQAGGANSSCGTSPEPLTHSPMSSRPGDALPAIGEEQPSLGTSLTGFGHFDASGDDFSKWLPQPDFQFDPHLFGDYRESQEGLFSSTFDDSFFNDALDVDFITPYNLPLSGMGQQQPTAPKKDLIAEIDAAKDADELPTTTGGPELNCSKIWERLQNCPKVQSGDFDLDGLCADLQKKARCNGHGAVVAEKDFDQVIQKWLCKDKDGKKDSSGSSNSQQNGDKEMGSRCAEMVTAAVKEAVNEAREQCKQANAAQNQQASA